MKQKEKNLSNSKRLMRIRELLKFSQRQMADEFGVVHGAIGLWETGKRKIPGPVLKLISLYEEELGLLAAKTDALEDLQQDWLKRTLKLSGMSSVLTQHLSGQVKKLLAADAEKNLIQQATERAIANQVVTLLGSLKGLPHKFGQFISYMDLTAPTEIQELYAQLQSSSPELHPARIVEIIVEEFGQTPAQLFAQWSHQPFAAASIGQVHLAKTKQGEQVAVKVQYPGIKNVISADLKNVKLLDQLGGFLLRSHEPEQVALELAERVLEECDYRKEAANQMELRKLHQKDERIIIPEIYQHLSSERVLTSKYYAAKNFLEFCKSATQAEKDFAGTVIWDHAFRSALKHRIFNADPHPGNYLFLPEQVVFLDYGCVKRISAEFFPNWQQFLRAVMQGNPQKVEAYTLKMNIVTDPGKFDFAAYYELMRSWYYPCYADEAFRFSKGFVNQQWEKMWAKFFHNPYMRFPKELLYINQLQWGLYAVLAHLEASDNWSKRFLPLLGDAASLENV